MRLFSPLRLVWTEGRAGRVEFVCVTLGVAAVEYLLVGGLHLLVSPKVFQSLGPNIYVGSLLVGGWLLLAVAVRRLHDLGNNGSLLVAGMLVGVGLTFVGALAVVGSWAGWFALPFYSGAYLILAVRPGTTGPNPYDLRPKTRVTAAESAVAAQQLHERMQRLARPTLLFHPATEPVFSKLGGAPDLPEHADWPRGRETSRAFVVQIDFAEVRASGGPEWLPEDGRLYGFAEDDGWDGPASVTCMFTRDPPGRPRAAPDGAAPAFREQRVGFARHASLPSPDWLGAAEDQLGTDDLIALTGLPAEPFGEGPQHRIGGYPSEIQSGQLALECEFEVRGLEINYNTVPADVAKAAEDWRLLLQIDTDDRLGMNWVDAGRLYIFVREQDARAGDFTRTATLCQFY